MPRKAGKHSESPPPVEERAGVPLTVLPPLTERQAKCLEYILNFFVEHRYYPTQREIADAMNIRSATAEMYLEPLELKGYLKREPGRHRNIRLTDGALEKLRLMGVDVRGLFAA
jgi:DNA-binding MarR family transcriptional regulator